MFRKYAEFPLNGVKAHETDVYEITFALLCLHWFAIKTGCYIFFLLDDLFKMSQLPSSYLKETRPRTLRQRSLHFSDIPPYGYV